MKAADEIGLPGVSLKSTFRVEAERIGASRLSESLPRLSAAAVELMLRSSRNSNGLIASSSNNGLVERVWLPSGTSISTLEELEQQGLIEIEADRQHTNSAGVRDAVEAFKRKHLGRDGGRGSGSIDDAQIWELTPPVKIDIPMLSWRLTDLGQQAVDVILKAVSQQLMPNDGAAKSK